MPSSSWLTRLFPRKNHPLTDGRSSMRRPPSYRLRLEDLEARLAPAMFTWSGLGGDANFTTNNNWGPGNSHPTGLPTDDLVFPAGPSQLSPNNNLVGATFNS